MDGDRTVQTSRHCIAEEDVLLMKCWSSVVPVSKNDVRAITVNDDDGSILNETASRSELKLQPALAVPMATAIDDGE